MVMMMLRVDGVVLVGVCPLATRRESCWMDGTQTATTINYRGASVGAWRQELIERSPNPKLFPTDPFLRKGLWPSTDTKYETHQSSSAEHLSPISVFTPETGQTQALSEFRRVKSRLALRKSTPIPPCGGQRSHLRNSSKRQRHDRLSSNC